MCQKCKKIMQKLKKKGKSLQRIAWKKTLLKNWHRRCIRWVYLYHLCPTLLFRFNCQAVLGGHWDSLTKLISNLSLWGRLTGCLYGFKKSDKLWTILWAVWEKFWKSGRVVWESCCPRRFRWYSHISYATPKRVLWVSKWSCGGPVFQPSTNCAPLHSGLF